MESLHILPKRGKIALYGPEDEDNLSLGEDGLDHVNDNEKNKKWDTYHSNSQTEENKNENTTSQQNTCVYCSKEKRVVSVNQLQQGQHITMPGEASTKHKSSNHRQVFFFKHHAIIKNVEPISQYRAKLTLIHFSRPKKGEGDKLKILETTKKYDLEYDELRIVQYKHSESTPKEIVGWAENGMKKLSEEYHIVLNNCEHFATGCVTGEKKSHQINTWYRRIKMIGKYLIYWFGQLFLFFIRSLFNWADEIANKVWNMFIAAGVTLGISGGLYLIYCCCKTCRLLYKKRNKKICNACCYAKIQDMWSSFGVYAVSSSICILLTKFVVPLVSCGLGLCFVLPIIVLSTILQISIPWIRRKLQSPYQYNSTRLESIDFLKPGVAISFKYYGLDHEAIVSESPEMKNSTEGTVKVIHYALPSILSRREIVEEPIPVDLKRKKIYILKYCSENTLSSDEAVKRAKLRLGEKKWSLSSNRSAHFCGWVKTGKEFSASEPLIDPANSYNDKNGGSKTFVGEDEVHRTDAEDGKKVLSTALLGEHEVQLMEEINVGDVVKYDGFRIGVVIGLEDQYFGRKFTMSVIFKRRCYGRKDKVKVDLNKHSLIVRKYHPVHCYEIEERKRRARDTVGKRYIFRTRLGFAEKIILLDRSGAHIE